MTTTQQPEALVFADDRPTSTSDDLYQWAIDAEDLIRAQHARIAELEDVADMAIKRIAELEAQLSAIGAGGVEPLRKAAKPQADGLVALNSLTRYTVGRCGNGPMHTFAHPDGPFLRYAEVDAALAAQAKKEGEKR